MTPEKEWWEERCDKTFKLCEIEHGCCLKEGEAADCVREIVARAHANGRVEREAEIVEIIQALSLAKPPYPGDWDKGSRCMGETILSRIAASSKK